MFTRTGHLQYTPVIPENSVHNADDDHDDRVDRILLSMRTESGTMSRLRNDIKAHEESNVEHYSCACLWAEIK